MGDSQRIEKKTDSQRVNADNGMPYVRYELCADVAEKGIAYSLKKALMAFMQSHNYVYKIEGFEPTSSSFRCILELYPGGNIDFNMKAMREHLETSGQLPTNEKLKPTVEVKPVPIDYAGAPVIQAGKNDLSWQGVVDSLTKKITELEGQNKSSQAEKATITKILADNQAEVVQLTGKIGGLEKQLLDATSFDFSNPVRSFARAYLPASYELMCDLAYGWAKLGQTGDRDFFISSNGGKGLDNVAKYVSAKFGLKFDDKKGLDEWLKNMSYRAWDESPEGKKLLDVINKYDMDIASAEGLLGNSQSTELLVNTMKELSAQLKSAKSSYETKLAGSRSSFDEEKRNERLVQNAFPNFPEFASVSSAAVKRKVAGASVPLIVHFNSLGVDAYLPSFDAKSDFEKHLAGLARAAVSFNLGGIKVDSECQEEMVHVFSRVSAPMTDEVLKQLNDYANSFVAGGGGVFEDRIARTLGAPLTPFCVVTKH